MLQSLVDWVQTGEEFLVQDAPVNLPLPRFPFNVTQIEVPLPLSANKRTPFNGWRVQFLLSHAPNIVKGVTILAFGNAGFIAPS